MLVTKDRWASRLRHPAFQILLTLMDVLSAVVLTFLGLVSGVHSGREGQLAGFIFFLPAGGLVIAPYASSLKHRWKSVMRMCLYLLLTLLAIVFLIVDFALPLLVVMLWFLGQSLISSQQLSDMDYWRQRAIDNKLLHSAPDRGGFLELKLRRRQK